jgi:hypothetical protein
MLLVLFGVTDEDAIGYRHKAKSCLDYLKALIRSVQGKAIYKTSPAGLLRPTADVRTLDLSYSRESQVEGIVLERTTEVPSAQGDLK